LALLQMVSPTRKKVEVNIYDLLCGSLKAPTFLFWG